MSTRVNSLLKILITSAALLLAQFITLVLVYRFILAFDNNLPEVITPIVLLLVAIGSAVLLNANSKTARKLCISSTVTAIIALFAGLINLQKETLIRGVLMYTFSLPIIVTSIAAWGIYYFNRRRNFKV